MKKALLCQALVFCMILLADVVSASHDPTKPLFNTLDLLSAQSKTVSLNLQSILISKTRRQALINGKLIGAGSSINGARVLAIDKNSVVLLRGQDKIILYLFDKKLWISK